MGSVRLVIVFLSLVSAVGFPSTQPAIRAFALVVWQSASCLIRAGERKCGLI